MFHSSKVKMDLFLCFFFFKFNSVWLIWFPFYFLFCYFILFFIFISSKLICPYEFFKSELYISAPILSALNSGPLQSNDPQISNSAIESRSMDSNGIHSSSYDYTREKSIELEHSIRFVSLSLAAKHIFKDMVVRRFVGFIRLVTLASSILDS